MAITKKINFTGFKITKTLTISDNFINTFGLTPHVYLYFGTSQNSPSEWIDLGDLSGDKTVDRSGTYGVDYIAYGFFANELSQTQKEFLIQRKIGKEQCDKIFYENSAEFYRNVLTK